MPELNQSSAVKSVEMVAAYVRTSKVDGQTVETQLLPIQKYCDAHGIKLMGGVTAILTLSKLLDPDSVELDPRSSKSGKIWVGKGHEIGIDVTAGLGAMVTAASRFVPTVHDGKVGVWYKTRNGLYIDLLKDKNKHPGDIIKDFFEQKASPLAGLAINYIDHKYFDKETASEKVQKLFMPMTSGEVKDLAKDKNTVDPFLYILLIAGGVLGVHVSVIDKNAWSTSSSKEIGQFKKKVGDVKFEKASEQYQKKFDNWYNKAKDNKEYTSLSDDDKATVQRRERSKLQKDIFENYGFSYKADKQKRFSILNEN